ncbi:MAG: acyl-CoA dehydratase activase [Desulfatiglandaceae bacterium]
MNDEGSTTDSLYAGIDVGASRTKVALLDGQKQLKGYGIQKSGVDFAKTADQCMDVALKMAHASKADVVRAVSTGYGRKNVRFSGGTKTEIACHARGCFHYFPVAMTIVDIGGQDNKIIKVDEAGRRISFKMNRKCAAGTGAFLEEMAMRLDIPLEEMDGLARQSDHMVELGSYCTVFSGTEVLEKIRQGEQVPAIVKGLFYSVIKRVLEMDSLTDKVAMTGGVVAHNPMLVTMVQEITSREVLVPDHPQLTGAVGAALFAIKDRGT